MITIYSSKIIQNYPVLGEYKLINLPVFQVDAFTDKPFIGNPAAVCLLMEEKSDEWMLNVAREMNCSEIGRASCRERVYVAV